MHARDIKRSMPKDWKDKACPKKGTSPSKHSRTAYLQQRDSYLEACALAQLRPLKPSPLSMWQSWSKQRPAIVIYIYGCGNMWTKLTSILDTHNINIEDTEPRILAMKHPRDSSAVFEATSMASSKKKCRRGNKYRKRMANKYSLVATNPSADVAVGPGTAGAGSGLNLTFPHDRESCRDDHKGAVCEVTNRLSPEEGQSTDATRDTLHSQRFITTSASAVGRALVWRISSCFRTIMEQRRCRSYRQWDLTPQVLVPA
jgi:hypothetical protein